jgi:hypothetical protein
MRHIIRLFYPSILLLTFFSCKKAENRDFYEGGTPPALSADKTGTIPLSYTTQDQEAIKLTWTNPNYMFTTGISSHDVSYRLEIDTTGSNFTNPNRKVIALSGDLSLTISQAQLNDYLSNQLILASNIPHNIEMRVTSSIGNTVPLPSNVLKFSGVTPYTIPPKVTPPSSGQLFITGDATDGGWMAGGGVGVPTPAQQFTQVSPTLYTLTVHLIGGKQFLFVPVNGDWSNKYACHDTGAQPADGGEFGYNGGNNTWNANFPGPGTDGTYKITVDFQRGKYTVTQ